MSAEECPDAFVKCNLILDINLNRNPFYDCPIFTTFVADASLSYTHSAVSAHSTTTTL